MCVSVCVCKRKRERERDNGRKRGAFNFLGSKRFTDVICSQWANCRNI